MAKPTVSGRGWAGEQIQKGMVLWRPLMYIYKYIYINIYSLSHEEALMGFKVIYIR